MDPEMREAISLEFCIMHLYQNHDIGYVTIYKKSKLHISTIPGQLAYGACLIAVDCYWLDWGSVTELWIHVKEFLFDDA